MRTDGDDGVIGAAEAFAEVARVLLSEHEVAGALQRIVHLAVEHLDAVEFAGISYVEGSAISSPASSNDLPRIVDKIQQEVGEGPCLDAIKDHEVFQTGNLAAEDRWPNFAARAHDETGVCSILSIRLFAERQTMGALNLYSTKPDAFGDTDVALAAVFATHAAVAMTSARREEQLEQKAASRDVIGQAKGILMAREHLSEDEAFDRIRVASQHLNLKLTTVAEEIAYSGEVPWRGQEQDQP